LSAPRSLGKRELGRALRRAWTRGAGDSQDPELRLIAEREGAVPGEVAPLEMLRAALHATKASGQPDWAARLSAVRALAALAPDEGEPETAQQPTTPTIVICDLPPGANPVLHRPASGAAEAPATAAPETPSEQAIPDSRVFQYLSSDGNSETIGMWSPAARGDFVKAVISITADPETSERWRAELAAGKLPQTNENDT